MSDTPVTNRNARRILHVPRRFVAEEWGGTETVLDELLHQQRLAGWLPEIHTSLALSRRRHDEWRGLPVRRYSYCHPFFGLSAEDKHRLDKKGGNILSVSLFLGMLARRRVRLFHAHVTKRLGGAVFTAARLRGLPCVVTLHGGVFGVPEGEEAHVQGAQRRAFDWGRPFGALFRSRALLHEADAVICVDATEAERAREALGHDRVVHIGNGVDVERFAEADGNQLRKRLGLSCAHQLIVCLARLDPQKDQALLVRAFNSIAAAHPRAHLVIAGPSTDADYAALLERLRTEGGHAERVHLLPAFAARSSALADAYAAADIFAIASRHEPFGIAVLEAWAAGRPVVASTAGGLGRLVVPERNGLSFAPGDEAGCAAALGRLLGSTDLCFRLGERGRADAAADHSWRSVAERTDAVYQAAEERVRRGGR